MKQKIKSHRPDASGRSGEISLGHHAESFAALETTSAFRMLLTNRNFTDPHFRPYELRCLGDSFLILFLFLALTRPPRLLRIHPSFLSLCSSRMGDFRFADSLGECNSHMYTTFQNYICYSSMRIFLFITTLLYLESNAQQIINLTSSDQTSFVSEHNIWRAEVGSTPLKWNNNMAKQSADYALKIAKMGSLVHSNCDEGENLYMTSAQVFSPEDAVNAWGREKEYYRAGTKINNNNYKQFGHYTQMIWYKTSEVGCGAAQSKYGTFVVCRYNPPGNFIGEKPTP